MMIFNWLFLYFITNSKIKNSLNLKQRSLFEIPTNSYQLQAFIGLLLGDESCHMKKNKSKLRATNLRNSIFI